MEKKLRHSRQREMIYQYMLSTLEHPSAEMVYSALREQIAGLSLGTVYRNLKLLEELGKVRRVASANGVERYDACCGDHAHFLCSSCGCLRDLEHCDTQTIRSALKIGEGYQLSKIDLTATGLCPECAGK